MAQASCCFNILPLLLHFPRAKLPSVLPRFLTHSNAFAALLLLLLPALGLTLGRRKFIQLQVEEKKTLLAESSSWPAAPYSEWETRKRLSLLLFLLDDAPMKIKEEKEEEGQENIAPRRRKRIYFGAFFPRTSSWRREKRREHVRFKKVLRSSPYLFQWLHGCCFLFIYLFFYFFIFLFILFILFLFFLFFWGGAEDKNGHFPLLFSMCCAIFKTAAFFPRVKRNKKRY